MKSEFSMQSSSALNYSNWYDRLNPCELTLIILYPDYGLLTYFTVQRAAELTIENYGKNGCGDESDAFRHAIWNLLMCRNINKTWAELFATAHECATEEDLNKIGCHGFTIREHTEMDLHNNNEGRKLWKWYDIWPREQTLVNRVLGAIDEGKLIWLVD